MLRLLAIAFRDGGWAMWGILALGLVGVGVAARFCWLGGPARLRSLRWLMLGLIASGCFGFVVDLQAVAQYSTVGLDAMQGGQGGVATERRVVAVLEGLNESLYCLSSAFLLTVVIALLVAVGHARSPRGAV